jgi:hypothetical protein
MADEDAEVQLVAPDGEVVASDTPPVASELPEDDPGPTLGASMTEQTVLEVLDGKWGATDSIIRRRLKKAGFNANTILAEVARLNSDS